MPQRSRYTPNYRRTPNDRRYQVANMLMQGATDTSPINSPWQSISRLAQALIGSRMYNKAQDTQKANNAKLGEALGMLSPQRVMVGSDAPRIGSEPQYKTVPGDYSGAAKMVSGFNPGLASDIIQQGAARQQSIMDRENQRAYDASVLAGTRKYNEGVTSKQNERKDALAVDAFNRAKELKSLNPGTTSFRNYQSAKQDGYTGSFNDYMIGQNVAKSGQIYTPPNRGTGGTSTGEYPTTGPVDIGTIASIPGSPADIKAKQLRLQEEKAQAAKDKISTKAKLRQAGRARSGGTVIQDIGRALNLVENNWSASGVPAIAGEYLPKSISPAAEAKSYIESALSNVGLDTLQAMRESSPTGGALGQVPIQQQKRLEQVLGSLDVTQRTDVLKDNLKRVQNIYMDIVYGKPEDIQALVDAGKITPEQAAPIMNRHKLSFDRFGNPVNGDGVNVPDGVDPADWAHMTPEEKALFQ